MHTDFDRLAQLNIDIGSAESTGTSDFLDGVLAPAFAIRRATGIIDDRDTFLRKVAPSPRRVTEIHSISLLGNNRAVVECTVSMTSEGEARSYHNLRLFVRDDADQWKLLGWANEST